MMKSYADLFSGCGGFSTGFHDLGMRGRLSVDFWAPALETAKLNHPKVPTALVDLSISENRQAVAERLQGVDLLLGGPPCQGFSTLGKRRDGDVRSTLVDAFAEICRSVRPRIALVENVKGITSKAHPSGVSYADALKASLREGGYRCSSNVLTLTDFGAAQTRSRWFLLAIREEGQDAASVEQNFWDDVQSKKTAHPGTLRQVIGDLPRLSAGEGAESFPWPDSRVIYNHRAMNHSAALVERLRAVPPGGGLPDVPVKLLTPHLKRLVSGDYGSGGHVKNVYGRLEWDRSCGTIVAGMDKITCGRFVHPDDDRLLTPRECARLQGFDDEFIFTGGQVSQYYQIGNAVPPFISRILASALISATSAKKRSTKKYAEKCA